MSTALTCTNPEEGWSLYSHFLGNCLLAIRGIVKRNDEEGKKEETEQNISKNRAILVGNLYMIMDRMKICGYDEDAVKMQFIIDMVVRKDLTDLGVHEAIHNKFEELNSAKGDFRAVPDGLKKEKEQT
jgi:hypothetical protein